MLSSAEIKDLKAKIKVEMQRRSGNGSLVSYATSEWDFSQIPDKNTPILTEHGKKTIEPILAIKPINGLEIPIKGKNIPKSFDKELITTVNSYSSESTTASTSSCAGACSGLCVGQCYSGCSGCSGGCNGCSGCGGCDNGCYSGCTSCTSCSGCTSCIGDCVGMCYSCSGCSGCSGGCVDSCSSWCQTGGNKPSGGCGCGSGCGAGCSGCSGLSK